MNIEEKIINFAKRNQKFKTSELRDGFRREYSRGYLSRVLSIMVNKNRLIRQGTGPGTIYVLPENAKLLGDRVSKRLFNHDLKEHEVLDDISINSHFLQNLDDDIKSIFDYAFSEMLNNAIEHSESNYIEVEVIKDKEELKFVIRDYGIGVFNSLMRKRNLKSELEAIQDLLKGKITTQSHSHSGEGIFFTSKVSDIFVLDSYKLRLRIDNKIGDIFVEEIKPIKGTQVSFNISLASQKHLSDVFKEYQTDPDNIAFDKTKVYIKLYKMGTIYVSRSQARRVLVGLEKFKSVVLDFEEVSTVGQAFADEIFRVYKLKYPAIEILPVNVNETVRFMIERVDKPQPKLF